MGAGTNRDLTALELGELGCEPPVASCRWKGIGSQAQMWVGSPCHPTYCVWLQCPHVWRSPVLLPWAQLLPGIGAAVVHGIPLLLAASVKKWERYAFGNSCEINLRRWACPLCRRQFVAR